MASWVAVNSVGSLVFLREMPFEVYSAYKYLNKRCNVANMEYNRGVITIFRVLAYAGTW